MDCKDHHYFDPWSISVLDEDPNQGKECLFYQQCNLSVNQQDR